MKRRNDSLFLFITLIIGLSNCQSPIPDEIVDSFTQLPHNIDYNFHVKPILSDRCFACHGPDAQNRQGNLRLDIEEEAFATLTSGNGFAIIPGKAKKSELIDRIFSPQPSLVMPPPESNLTLSPEEKAILFKWIEQGANYKTHWAFNQPQQQSLPSHHSDWATNEIDLFIEEKLHLNQVTPSPEASREQLIRRVFFDLTGLPPTLEELDRILSDQRPDYYGHLVDSLLTLTSFGERMAAHWLDVARFADSEGYLDDFHHTFWPYRDWVIKAFNQNLPYDQFILWQIGGDQLPNPTTEQQLATAFNRNHKQNSEGGIIPEEFRVEYVADRTNTIGAAFMGLTLGCARCHDHKYDPISQKNYFELFGFFNSTIERGDGIFGFNAVENGQRVPNALSMNAGPVLPLPTKEVQEIRDFLLQQIDEKRQVVNHLQSSNQDRFNEWRKAQRNTESLQRAIDRATITHLTFDDMANGKASDSARGAGPVSYWGDVEAAPGVSGLAVKSAAQGQLVADGMKARFERTDPFTISFWIKAPTQFDNAHVLYNGNNRIQGYRGWDIVLDSTGLHFRLNHAHPYQSIDIQSTSPLPIDQWTHFTWTYDGQGKAGGMHLFINGQSTEFKIARNYLYRSTKPYLDTRATVYMPYKGIIIGNRHYDQDFTGGLLDEIRILNNESGPLTAEYLYDSAQALKHFENSLQQEGNSELHQFYNLYIDPRVAQEKAALKVLQNKEVTTIDTVQEVMVMRDFEKERPTYILERGVYDAKGQLVEKNVPNAILPWSKEWPKNRLGLAKWLIAPEHPLTARVAVNQFWYLMFGRGIVETAEDFGNQGALPSHPELLDWLAVDFMEHGWNVKRVIRMMVTSSAYRQSSVIRTDLQTLDPDNYLLARGPRYRRSAEMIRDNLLVTSDLLDPTIGGPSTFPYQAPGLWKETTSHAFFPGYKIDYQNGLYRRSIYTFWKRNMPPPSMLIFDAAHRGECQVRRQRSNTPLQALVLLNDIQMIEGCRALALKHWRASNGNTNHIFQNIFRSLTSRSPNVKEIEILQQQYEEELAYFNKNPDKLKAFMGVGKQVTVLSQSQDSIAAVARLANTILNTTESYYKN